MAPLLALIVFLGVYPKPMLDRIEPRSTAWSPTSRSNSDYVEPAVAPARRRRRGDGPCSPRPPPRPSSGPRSSWCALAPLLVLVGGGLLLLVAVARSLPGRWPRRRLRPLHRRRRRHRARSLSRPPVARRAGRPGPCAMLGGASASTASRCSSPSSICVAVILAALLPRRLPPPGGAGGAELYVLMLLSASGGVMMASANDLIVMFLGLEILSIAVYVLAAMHLRQIASQEAGVKYFVLGAFSSAFFLYGIALVYGATGSTNLVEIVDFLRRARAARQRAAARRARAAARRLRLQGRRGAVPLLDARRVPGRADAGHRRSWPRRSRWPAFAGLLRVFFLAFGAYRVDWQPIVYVAGRAHAGRRAVLAIVQTDVKRMLAYSSINHAGFILVASCTAGQLRNGATGARRPCSSTSPPTRSWWSAASASSRSSAARATSATASTTTAACPAAGRCSRSRSPSSCSPRPACRSRPASSPSST